MVLYSDFHYALLTIHWWLLERKMEKVEDKCGLMNFEYILHSQVLLNEQVTTVARMAFAKKSLMYRLCPFLDQGPLLTDLSHFQLYCCNALYIGLSLKNIWKLPLVQNAAACAVLGAPKFTHMTSIVEQVTLTPVYFWMQCKVWLAPLKLYMAQGRFICLLSLSKDIQFLTRWRV